MPQGLVPATDDDYDKAKRLKTGETYKVKVTLPRNYPFLRKFFALIRCAWEYLGEEGQRFFKNNIEKFRQALILQAGYSDSVYNPDTCEWFEVPKSVSFDKMEEAEFQDLYNGVRQVIFDYFLPRISEKEFDRELAHF